MGVSLNSLPPHVRELVEQTGQLRGDQPKNATAHAARAVHRPNRMNTTEQAYARALELRRSAGEIQRYDFEPEKLRLADRTFYMPDFRVILAHGEIEMHEVKGHWEDDARVKIKVAAVMHPYRFIAVTKAGDGWRYETF